MTELSMEGLNARLRAVETLIGGLKPTTLSRAALLSAEPLIFAISKDASFETGVSTAEILSDSRLRRIFRVRCAIAWIARETTDYSLPRIARALGDRDHTSIMHAIARAEEFRQSDPAFLLLTNRLMGRTKLRAPAAAEHRL